MRVNGLPSASPTVSNKIVPFAANSAYCQHRTTLCFCNKCSHELDRNEIYRDHGINPLLLCLGTHRCPFGGSRKPSVSKEIQLSLNREYFLVGALRGIFSLAFCLLHGNALEKQEHQPIIS